MGRYLKVWYAALLLAGTQPAMAADHADTIRRKFDQPSAGVFIVAHRGCHNASPQQKLAAAPENSLAALEHCVRLGVDMMELDVRRSADGALVVIHDATVDRTTDGRGKVADLTLAQLQALRLKQNMGAQMSPELTDEHLSTLAQMLAAARGRIMINLDIKDDDIYAQTIAEATAHGMARYVLVKSFVNLDAAGVGADDPAFAAVPYMPIVGAWTGKGEGASAAQVVTRQLAAQRRPAGVELVFLPREQLAPVRKLAAAGGVRLWANTLTSVGVISVIGMGGDLEALRTSGRAWGDLIGAGVDTIQTDEPGPLLAFLKRQGIRH
ncbi:glycerophosphodiester phosphodiesterase family protein [Duganella phyllosphaerae]|uniref:Putative glycerophosphoryl diester phosphodiesterase 1 n=1 Tax=Duganella phyllosphaerae TaxID=762836 RepID=A0A1E7WCM1_9BURK|nr:glycerophosphodiester phosphodiesterase family protein [Duganella phyllosphaerae]OEZ95347.1 putative glycerophosphoryl diester phosphodiesterase 1 [Duganella phyllosphaerae]